MTQQHDPNNDKMLFPIGTISDKTGVKTVTLRAWERRYGLLKPQRTPKGHRLYSMDDVERVNHVLRLLDQGIPVNRVRAILDQPNTGSPNLVSITHDSKAKEEDPWRFFAEQFTKHIRELDSRSLDRAFNQITSSYSLDLVAKKLVLPLYEELQKNNAAFPAMGAEQAFFDEFLRASLGAGYLRNNQTLPRHHKSLLFKTGSQPLETIKALLLANIVDAHKYEVNFINEIADVNALPLVLQRNNIDALILLDAQIDSYQINILAQNHEVSIFVGHEYETPKTHSSYFQLDANFSQASAQISQQLSSDASK